MVTISTDRRSIRFGPYCADLRACELTKHGRRLKLQARPFEILTMLLERPGEVVTREEMRGRLWPDGTFVDFDNNISSAVRKLRDALCDSAVKPRYIETAGRVGYRFIAQEECVREEQLGGQTQPSLPSVPAMDPSAIYHSKKSPEATIHTAIDVVPPVDASLTDHRYGRWFHSRRLVLVSILLVGIVVTVITFWRHWLTSVRASTHVNALSRPFDEAAAGYSMGRELWAHRGEGPLEAAIQQFRAAIEKRPDYGLAYSGLADAYVLLPFYSRLTQAEAFPKAKSAALRAVELAPQSAEAHTSLAYVKLYSDWDFRGAEEEFRIALNQNPNYPTALQWHAEYLALIGHYDEAVAQIRRGIELLPDSPIMHHNAGQIYQSARRYDEAIEEYKIALRLDPKFGTSNVFMALAYIRKGMHDKAFELQLQYVQETGDTTRTAIVNKLADRYRSEGGEGYLRELIAIAVEENPDRDSYRIAQWYAMLGENDLAFQYLERAYELHQSDLLGMNADPEFDSLRSDPRFLSLRRRVGLPLQVVEFF